MFWLPVFEDAVKKWKMGLQACSPTVPEEGGGVGLAAEFWSKVLPVI